MFLNEGFQLWHKNNLFAIATSGNNISIMIKRNGDSFDLLAIKPTLLKKLVKEITFSNYEDYKQLVQFYGFIDFTNYFDIIYKYPKIFNLKSNISKKFLHEFLTQISVSDETFIKFFGELPEASEKFKNARLYFPQSMRKSSKDKLYDVVETVYNYLDANNLEKVFHTKIVFTKLPTNKLGVYYIERDFMEIDSSISHISESIIFTLLHEYGHRFYYKFMSENNKKLLVQKYNEAIDQKISNDKHIKLKDFFSQHRENIHFLYKKKEILHIQEIRNDSLYCYFTSNPKVKVTLPYESNLATGKIIDITNKTLKKEYIDIYNSKQSNSWFQREYSKKNHEEFFSDLFADYLMNNLGEEQRKFVELLLKN